MLPLEIVLTYARSAIATQNRILNALGVGKQSPQYKRVKAILDQLIPKI
jgi:hypothetical protein